MPHVPSLRAIVATSALLLAVLAAASLAGPSLATAATPPAPSDDPPSIAQLCAATGDDTIDALLDGVAETDLVGALAPLVSLTVPQDQGRVLRAGVDVDDVREALDCAPLPTTSPSPPTSTTVPDAVPGDERDCSDFATRQDAQDFYDSVTTPGNPDPSKLDRDGDRIACEPTEGPQSGGLDPTADDGSIADTSGTQVVDVPSGSASTGA